MKENDICHIACVKRYLYNNNLEQLIIMIEVTTCISVRLLNHIDCCFNNSTNWEFDQEGWSPSDIWLRTILMRKETRCRHIGYSFRLTARVLLYASSHIQDNTYHGICYTSRGALAGTRNSSMGHHEASIRRPIAP